MKKLLCLLSFAGLALNCYAQTTDEENPDKEKKFNHHIGLQVNELIRQVFNFSNSSNNTVDNPFVLTYNVNSTKTGWGARLGLGYSYRSLLDDDGITRRKTDINELNVRVGVDKAFELSKNWTAGVGVDFIVNINDDLTTSLVRSFDTTTTVTDAKISSFGGGPMVWLRYKVSGRVYLGTEASYYYLTGKDKQEITLTKRNFNLPGGPYQTTSSAVETDFHEGIIRVPVAIYLIVRL
jgi:hypothetical protein